MPTSSTGSRGAVIVNHGLSILLFIVCLVEFLLLPAFATPTFFLLMAMVLLDVVAGFIMTIAAARREAGLFDMAGFARDFAALLKDRVGEAVDAGDEERLGGFGGDVAGCQSGAAGCEHEAGARSGRGGDRSADGVDVVGIENEQVGARLGVFGVREPHDDAVVGSRCGRFDSEALLHTGVDRKRPGRMHRGAVRRVQH